MKSQDLLDDIAEQESKNKTRIRAEKTKKLKDAVVELHEEKETLKVRLK